MSPGVVRRVAVMIVPPPVGIDGFTVRGGVCDRRGLTRRRGARTAKFELFKDAAGKFRFHLKGSQWGDHRDQGYTSKAAAQNGIASIKDNAASAPTEDLT
ncbi:YegP family protein [Rhodococcus sp. NPDC057529]|uniref:YegP family protein n=1 Tax=Rhodococcus sp. NPDC057529 TaxID=3346158 RepID=UPI00366B63BF